LNVYTQRREHSWDEYMCTVEKFLFLFHFIFEQFLLYLVELVPLMLVAVLAACAAVAAAHTW
jgi:hypothetical protein